MTYQAHASVREAYDYWNGRKQHIGSAMLERLRAAAHGEERWDESYNWVLHMVPGFPKMNAHIPPNAAAKPAAG